MINFFGGGGDLKFSFSCEVEGLKFSFSCELSCVTNLSCST